MDRRTIVLPALALALGALWWVFLRPGPPPPEEWQGYADADFVKVGPTLQGLITAVHVQRGDRVVKGAPLFDQDAGDDRDAVNQAERQVQQTQDLLANYKNPSKPTEIAMAEANLRGDTAARDKLQSDLQRNQTLLKTGAVTVQTVADEEADLRTANAKVAADQAALEQAKAPFGRPAEILAQTAAVDAAEAALAMARWRLDQRSVVSPFTGVVADVLAQPGEALDAGAPVVSLLPPENIFIRFFVPEPSLAHVRVGDTVALLCDSCPSDLTGTVSYIAPQAEYTPPFIYSETTRSKFVFLAEARPKPAEATLFNPGQPVSVRPRAPPP